MFDLEDYIDIQFPEEKKIKIVIDGEEYVFKASISKDTLMLPISCLMITINPKNSRRQPLKNND